MSYFEGQTPAWANQHGRQQSWDQAQVSAHSSSVSTPQREENFAFSAQFEEIDRASDNLNRTGKGFGGPPRGMPPTGRFPRQYNELDRSHNGPRPGSISEYDGVRSHSAHSSTSVQGYYASQRFGPRPSEAEQMMHAKRRAAAQRERDLRNYHQEQQYNRNLPAAKTDRAQSPNAMSEEDRRELIARQHRALYGDGASLYGQDGAPNRPLSQDARVLAVGQSPLVFDAFNPPASSTAESNALSSTTGGPQQRSPTNSAPSKSPNPNAFTMFDSHQQSNAPQAKSPTESPPRSAGPPGVAPIGTRTVQQKRTTPPAQFQSNSAERSTSAASNPNNSGSDKPVGLGWGSNAGPWSNNKPLGVQASVWG